jgi:SRSO17 transposase
MKEELGLDHFEGRSWQGLHRHALMTMIAMPSSSIGAWPKPGGKKASTADRRNRARRPYDAP